MYNSDILCSVSFPCAVFLGCCVEEDSACISHFLLRCLDIDERFRVEQGVQVRV